MGNRTKDGSGSSLYDTLVSISASDGGLNMTRIVPQLFPIKGIPYGHFATASQSQDENLYLLGGDGAGGLKLARVPWEFAAQTAKVSYSLPRDALMLKFRANKYSYWSKSGWTSNSTAIAVTVAQTVEGAQYSSGDVFWSAYHRTWFIVSLTSLMNEIYIQYSIGGHIMGPYSKPELLYRPSKASSFGNYAGHAYPQWLSTSTGSKELIISWTYNSSDTRMALVTFF